MIVAYDNNRVIGNHGDIPWQGKMRTDSRYFRDMTLGHPVIMGSKTYLAMNRLLPNRPNIILTRDKLSVEGAVVVHTLEEAFRVAEKLDELVFVIGGGHVYEAALNMVDAIYATEIDASNEGDALFPQLDPLKWVETKRDHHEADEKNTYNYDFVTYKRKG